MKSISMFIMILICMVSFTSTATTAKMEQKRRTEFVKGISLVANAVSIVNEINVISVIADATIKTEFKAKSFEKKEPITFEATIDDVGWRSKKIYFITFYKEKQPNLKIGVWIFQIMIFQIKTKKLILIILKTK